VARGAALLAGSGNRLTRHLANLLSMARLVLTAPIVALILTNATGNPSAAALLFAGAGLTDLLDGRVARHQGRVSAFGCLLDPIADKCVIDASILALTLVHAFPLALAALFLGRDLAVTVLRAVRATRADALAPSRMAKLKTCALYLGVGGLILGRSVAGPVPFTSWALVGSAAVLSLISGQQYLRRAVSALPASRTLP
jgi:CDP-diacylglycerol--glycerol-3-phosphate 3-phosphatidyltransferase